MIKRTLEERLADLTTKLEDLTIQQDEINERVIHIRREVATLTAAIQYTSTQAATATRNETNRIEAVARSGYYIEELVAIINPSRGHEHHGIIIGETRDKLLKVKPSVGKYIKRLPKNVRRT